MVDHHDHPVEGNDPDQPFYIKIYYVFQPGKLPVLHGIKKGKTGQHEKSRHKGAAGPDQKIEGVIITAGKDIGVKDENN